MVACSLIRFCFDDTGFWQFHDPFAQQVFIEHTVCAGHCFQHGARAVRRTGKGFCPHIQVRETGNVEIHVHRQSDFCHTLFLKNN